MDQTKIYKSDDFQDAIILETMKRVARILEERGYQPIHQIVGYLMSGDPGYITSYKDARNMILSLERSRIIEVLVKESLL